jgi:MYXO-CTERM domain-containing protein
MSQPEPVRPEPGPDAGIAELQDDIAQTRKELGQTVEDLSAKLDVKQRTKDKAAETKERVSEKAHAVQHAAIDDGRAKVTVPAAAAVVLGMVALLWLIRRRRS